MRSSLSHDLAESRLRSTSKTSTALEGWSARHADKEGGRNAFERPGDSALQHSTTGETCGESDQQEPCCAEQRVHADQQGAEAGCSALQIGAITGHKTLKEVSRYTAAADQERMARDAVDKLSG